MSEINSLSGLLSANGPNFNLLGAGDLSDAVFMDMVLYLNNTDKALAAKMKELRALEKQKEQLNLKLERLNAALANSSAKEPDDYVYVPGGLEKPADINDVRKTISLEKQHKIEKDIKDNVIDQEMAQQLGIEGKTILWRVVTKQSALNSAGFYTKKQVEAEIEKTRSQMEQLNSSTQIFMIDLQRLINQRNQAVEFTTNVIAKEERTTRNIIENLK